MTGTTAAVTEVGACSGGHLAVDDDHGDNSTKACGRSSAAEYEPPQLLFLWVETRTPPTTRGPCIEGVTQVTRSVPRGKNSGGGVAAPLPSAVALLSRPADAATGWSAGLADPTCAGDLPSDVGRGDRLRVDLRELQGQEGVSVLCRFFAAVGRRLASRWS